MSKDKKNNATAADDINDDECLLLAKTAWSDFQQKQSSPASRSPEDIKLGIFRRSLRLGNHCYHTVSPMSLDYLRTKLQEARVLPNLLFFVCVDFVASSKGGNQDDNCDACTNDQNELETSLKKFLEERTEIEQITLSGNLWGPVSGAFQFESYTPLLDCLSSLREREEEKESRPLHHFQTLRIQRLHLHGFPMGHVLGKACRSGSAYNNKFRLECEACEVGLDFMRGFASAVQDHDAPSSVSFHSCSLAANVLAPLTLDKKEERLTVGWNQNTMTQLDISSASLVADALPAVATLLSQQRLSLERLVLKNNRELFDLDRPDSWNGFVTTLGDMPALQVLDLSSCKINIALAVELFPALESCRELSLCDSGLFCNNDPPLRGHDPSAWQPSAVKLFDWIAKSPSLMDLDLRHCGINNHVVVPLFRALDRNAALQKLDLRFNDFDPVAEWVDYLPRMSVLQELRLPPCSNEDMPVLERALKQNTSITVMGDSNWFSESIPPIFAQITKRNKSLAQARTLLRSEHCRNATGLWPRLLRLLSAGTVSNASGVYTFYRAAAR